jgi:hypothetical protein
VPREAAGRGFLLVALDEALVRVAFRLIRDKQSRRPAVDCLRTLRFDEALSDRVEGARHGVVNGGGCLCEDSPTR